MLPAAEEPMSIKDSSPAFINKLWKIVNDHATNDLIHWSMKGSSFFITDQLRFTYELIPRYFRHSNWASFIRQLNIYGFKKVSSLDSGSLVSDSSEVEFFHSFFQRGKEELLSNIKRKPQIPSRPASSGTSDPNIEKVLQEVEGMKKNQETLTAKFHEMASENELLWKEYANIRLKFSKQQQIIEKLVHFLVALVKNSPGGSTLGTKRKFNHLALEGTDSTMTPSCSGSSSASIQVSADDFNSGSSGPTIHELTDLNPGSVPECLEKVIHFPPSVSPGSVDQSSPIEPFQMKFQSSPEPSFQVHSNTPPRNHSYSDLNEVDQPSDLFQIDEFLIDSSLPDNEGNSSGHGIEAYEVDPLALESDLDTSLLRPVSLAEVSPNVVATSVLSSAQLDSQEKATRGKTLGEVEGGKNTTNFLPNNKTLLTINPETQSSLSVPINPQFGKKGKKCPNKHSPPLPVYQKPINEIALPSSKVEGEDFLNSRLEDTQNSLDFIKELLTSGSVNIDSSTLLSLFNPDEQSGPLNEMNLDKLEEPTGNEVSVYNPSLYDIMSPTSAAIDGSDADASTGVQRKASDGKKLRLLLPEEEEWQEDGLSTPWQNF